MEHPKSIEHRSGFEGFSGTRDLLLAALARNQEHIGRTFDVGRVLGFLWNDCTRRTPLHFDTCDDADTCPSLATTDCGQQRRGQRRSDLRKVAHFCLPITLPVGNALARWQLTTRRATRSGFISPFQTVGPTLVGMLSVG